MALIWARGFSDGRALAPAWLALSQAAARYESTPPEQVQQYAEAAIAERDARRRYNGLVAEATKALAAEAQPLTHIMIVGVGRYDADPNIPAVTTSVNGARKFAEWALTKFIKEDRPLGSIEFVCSTATGQAEWAPSDAAGQCLGLRAQINAFPAEPATFQNIKTAFESWLARAGTKLENAAIWYFAGHGLFKSEAIIMAQDSRLPTEDIPGANLIAPTQTLYRLQSRKPSVQCFFVDACSEYNAYVINNPVEVPGEALCGANNGPAIPNRDATIYFGSYAGGKAYGPANDAPYFTQELIACLTKRAGDPTYEGSQVTLSSLSQALKAAASYRAEIEKNDGISFAETKPGVIGGSGVLCDLIGPQEIIVQVRCLPKDVMTRAKLYMTDASNGTRIDRAKPLGGFWYTIVAPGKWAANADLDNATYVCSANPFEPKPPVFDAMIKTQAAILAGKPRGTKT
ncbi:hypothetical protein XH81_03990 [Bradyrhizobium sp. CCBAU 25360]|uniref:caspase family protein n=1 Tax=Bradyrhizobium sp. CCBAU 25360 TaxID=858425 RepID=UPI00230683B0|nr:caspase family protein [Bradyrhizobium sp. CCBAU 25360]MDA9414030.1 hypothetical protein [Bradyrhizobium sp. CCBAU 25360]